MGRDDRYHMNTKMKAELIANRASLSFDQEFQFAVISLVKL